MFGCFLTLILISPAAYAIPPNANAGPDQPSVNEQTVGVTLDGSGSNDLGDGGAIVTYAWSQLLGTTVTLSNTAAISPTFTAPTRLVSQGPEVLRFQLTVTDDGGESASDTVDITIIPVNSNPVANAGGNQSVNEQTGVNLNGNGSSDNDGPIAAFAWAQIPSATVALSGASTSSPSFTAPTRLVSQGSVTLTFQLTVTDGDGVTDNDTVNVTVNPVNADPTANAGPNQTVNETSPVTLNGSGSDDSDGSIATYAWSQTAGPAVTLAGANSAGPTFTSPTLPGNSNDQLTFSLLVTDNEGATDTDTVSINVNQVNVAPVIQSQSPLSTPEDTAIEIVRENLTVNDPDDTYPDDFTLSAQDGANYTRAGNIITPAANFVGPLSVPVTVNDGQDNSPVFNVTITVTETNDAPQITGQQNLSTPEDTPITILISNLTVVDPDNAPSELTLVLLDGANYTISGNTGTSAIVTPAANFNGGLTVGATVSDDVSTSAVFPLAVDVISVNDLPIVISPIGPQNAVEMSNFNLDISGNFADADNEQLRFTATGLPPSGNISLDPNTGVFSGTPRFEDTQNPVYNITVTATDGANATAVDSFQLTIAALDRANVSLDIGVAPDPAMLNDELRWTFTARNPVGPQAGANIDLDGTFVGDGLTVTETGTNNCTIQSAGSQMTDFSCAIGGLPVGGSTSIVVTAATSQAGDVFVFATVAGINPVPIDPNPDDNSDQMAVGVAEAFSNGALQILGSSNVRSVAVGDLNNDLSGDLVVGTAAGQAVQVYLNDGFRGFVATPVALPDNMANEGVALAHFDNNGFLDLVVANGGGQPDMVYSNNGAGVFTPMATLGSTFAQDVAVGDFDDDGNMDIVIATSQGNPVYLGNGGGQFTLHDTLGNANSRAVAVGRLDNNSRDDVVFANVGSDSSVWTKNSGSGFTSRDSLPIGDATSVAVGDFGGNSRVDLAFGRIPTGVGDIAQNPVLINDGSGRFGNPSELLGAAPTNDIHAGDVNGDALADLVFINASGVHQIWNATNNGFELHREQIVDGGALVGALTELGMTDVGDPGGLDLAMGGAISAGIGVFLNDGSGNLGRGDAVPPELTLVGSDPFNVPAGTTFVDPGAAATDNIDGDISNTVIATDTVDSAVVGSYTVTYNVTDFAGNSAIPLDRTVIITVAAGTGGGGGGAIAHWVLALLFAAIAFRYILPARPVRVHRERRAPK